MYTKVTKKLAKRSIKTYNSVTVPNLAVAFFDMIGFDVAVTYDEKEMIIELGDRRLELDIDYLPNELCNFYVAMPPERGALPIPLKGMTMSEYDKVHHKGICNLVDYMHGRIDRVHGERCPKHDERCPNCSNFCCEIVSSWR